tara:strand:+ start:1400 stop:1555 length:156 start_codon:yes stop_codon:yes gene_type:complete
METIIILILIIVYFVNTFTLIGLRAELKKAEKDMGWYRMLFKDKYTNDNER